MTTPPPFTVSVTPAPPPPGPGEGPQPMVVTIPTRFYVQLGAHRVFLADDAGEWLNNLSHTEAARRGAGLHHAEWTITRDLARIEDLTAVPGHENCGGCIVTGDQTRAYLADHQEAEVAAGRLWWVP